MTGEQKQTLKEFDAQQEKLERQLKVLREQIGEYMLAGATEKPN